MLRNVHSQVRRIIQLLYTVTADYLTEILAWYILRQNSLVDICLLRRIQMMHQNWALLFTQIFFNHKIVPSFFSQLLGCILKLIFNRRFELVNAGVEFNCVILVCRSRTRFLGICSRLYGQMTCDFNLRNLARVKVVFKLFEASWGIQNVRNFRLILFRHLKLSVTVCHGMSPHNICVVFCWRLLIGPRLSLLSSVSLNIRDEIIFGRDLTLKIPIKHVYSSSDQVAGL